MLSDEVTVALVAALVSVIVAVVFWSARRKPSLPKEKDRAWDIHARKRYSSPPAEPPPPSTKRKPSPAKAADTKPASKPAAKLSPPAKPKPAPPAKPKLAPPPKPAVKAELPKLFEESEEDDDLTIITVGPLKPKPKLVTLPSTDLEEDDSEPELLGAVPIVYDEDAALDEPTHIEKLILVSAAGHTDRGQRRRKNEDSFAILDNHGIFVVADGMGGHSGGEVASKIAVDTISDAFKNDQFPGEHYAGLPRRGSELALAIQKANQAIYARARAEQQLTGMGTTVVSARFSPNKQRAYIGHVGDSRCYRLRSGELRQITTDHTMGAAGLTGPLADRLERAVGIGPAVKVDIILARPMPEDLYLLCSDGLSKMVPAEQIREILLGEKKLDKAATKLVERANASGGRDNITVILVKVTSPAELARLLSS